MASGKGLEESGTESTAGLRLLVTSQGLNAVLRYDGATGGAPLDQFDPANEGHLSIPTGIAKGPQGKDEIYVANFHGQPSVNRYDAQTGRFLGGVVRNAVGAIGIARGYEDDLYLLSERCRNILRLALTSTGEFCGNITAEVENGTSIAFRPVAGPDTDAAIYVSYPRLNQIIRFSMGKVSSIKPPPYGGSTIAFRELSDPAGLAFGPDGLLYVANRGTNSILCYAPEGRFLGEFVAPHSGGLNSPYGIAFGPDGNLYVASRMSNQVLRYHGPQSPMSGTYLDAFIPAVPEPVFLMFYSI